MTKWEILESDGNWRRNKQYSFLLLFSFPMIYWPGTYQKDFLSCAMFVFIITFFADVIFLRSYDFEATLCGFLLSLSFIGITKKKCDFQTWKIHGKFWLWNYRNYNIRTKTKFLLLLQSPCVAFLASWWQINPFLGLITKCLVYFWWQVDKSNRIHKLNTLLIFCRTVLELSSIHTCMAFIHSSWLQYARTTIHQWSAHFPLSMACFQVFHQLEMAFCECSLDKWVLKILIQ